MLAPTLGKTTALENPIVGAGIACPNNNYPFNFVGILAKLMTSLI